MPANNPNPNPLSGQIANLSACTTQGFNALQGQNAQILSTTQQGFDAMQGQHSTILDTATQGFDTLQGQNAVLLDTATQGFNALQGQNSTLLDTATQGFNALQGQNAQILDSVSTTHRFRIFWTIILCIAALLIGLIPAFALGEAYVKDRHQATVEDTGLWVVHGDSMIAPPAIDQPSNYYWRGCQKEERAKYLAIVIGIDVTVGLAGALIGVCIDNASSNRRRRRNQNNPNPNNPNPNNPNP